MCAFGKRNTALKHVNTIKTYPAFLGLLLLVLLLLSVLLNLRHGLINQGCYPVLLSLLNEGMLEEEERQKVW